MTCIGNEQDGRAGAPDIGGVAPAAYTDVTEAVASGGAPEVIELRGGMSVPAPVGVVWTTAEAEDVVLPEEIVPDEAVPDAVDVEETLLDTVELELVVV